MSTFWIWSEWNGIASTTWTLAFWSKVTSQPTLSRAACNSLKEYIMNARYVSYWTRNTSLAMFFYKRGFFSACFLLQLSLNFWNSVFSKLQGPVIFKIHVFENETSHWVLFHVFGHFFPNKEIAETWIHRNRSEEVINRSPMRSNIIPVAHNVGAQANCTTMSCPAAGLRAGHGHAWIETLAIWKSKSKISRSIMKHLPTQGPCYVYILGGVVHPRGSRYLGCCFRS